MAVIWAHRPGQEYDLYFGEYAHHATPGNKYAVVGAFSCPRLTEGDLFRWIKTARDELGAREITCWDQLGTDSRAYYWKLMELFLEDPELQFRAVLVDRQAFDVYQNRVDLAADETLPTLHNLYYLMLSYWLGAGVTYRLYWDPRDPKPPEWYLMLHRLLERKLSGRAQIAGLGPIDPRWADLAGLADVLVGAVGHAWNGLYVDDVHADFCRDLAAGLGRGSLTAPAPPDDLRFRVYEFKVAKVPEEQNTSPGHT